MKKLDNLKTGKPYLYFSHLEDADQKILARLIRKSVKEMRRCNPAKKMR